MKPLQKTITISSLSVFFLLFLFQVPIIKQTLYEQFLEQLIYKKTVFFIDADEVKTDKHTILDTRSEAEFLVSHLPNARRVGFKDFSENNLKGLSKNDTIIVYCSVGYRSERIGEKLLQLGYKKVFNLKGGVFKWINKGYKMQQDSLPTTAIHPFSTMWGVWLQEGEKQYFKEK